MKRNDFLKMMALLPFTSTAMKLDQLKLHADTFPDTMKMPALFLGHGNPMNAIEENEFVEGFRTMAKAIPKPNAILCISAHWETKGTFVTAMEMPRTIHDFGGFPQKLFDVQYPAPGSPALATETQKIITKTAVELDDTWGLDHGAWSVIKHLYPNADIPVIQLSLDYAQGPTYHYELAKELNILRSKGVLIIGSGNLVHNLSMVAWDKIDTIGFGFDWALEAREKMNDLIVKSDYQSLINYQTLGRAFQLAIPTPEHYLPLLYVLALKDKQDEVVLFNDQVLAGSLTMTSVKIG